MAWNQLLMATLLSTSSGLIPRNKLITFYLYYSLVSKSQSKLTLPKIEYLVGVDLDFLPYFLKQMSEKCSLPIVGQTLVRLTSPSPV